MLETLSQALSAVRHRGPVAVGWEGLCRSGFYNAIWNTTTSRYPVGTNVFDRDWDVLVILDTCRPDALQDVSDERAWLDEIGELRSIGSSSPEWYLNTFTEAYSDELKKTALISGNIYANRVLNEWTADTGAADDFLKRGNPDWKQMPSRSLAHFEQITGAIKSYEPLHSESSAIPHILTDRAIAVGRQGEWDQLIIHYTLPHMPMIANALDWNSGEQSVDNLMSGPDEIRKLRKEEIGYRPYAYGEVSSEKAYQNFLDNLRLALDYVEILLENIDAERVVISADHGEALGEWGLWDHEHGFPFSPMRTVPWAETTASDEGTYSVRYESREELPNESEQEEFLKQMGYL